MTLRFVWGIWAWLAGGIVAAPLPEFWFGADLSYVNEMDDHGAVFRDADGPRDAYALFAAKGTHVVRLRLWHRPGWTDYSTLADVKRSIGRAHAAGMAVLLDFHYSDDWADPGDQIVPAAWRDLDEEALVTAVHDYTERVLRDLHAAGLLPEAVQVGNETNTEILLPAKVEESEPIRWSRNVRLLNAGLRAVHEVAAETGRAIDTMLHIAQPEFVEPWLDAAVAAGIADFDTIGISYYPKWSKFDLSALGAAMERLRTRFGKKVVVVETAYPWTLAGNDAAGNILGEDSLAPGYPATPDGQKRFLIDLTQTIITAGGSGVVYWEPAWVSSDARTRWGQGSHWENATFFDFAGRAHSGFDFMTHRYRR